MKAHVLPPSMFYYKGVIRKVVVACGCEAQCDPIEPHSCFKKAADCGFMHSCTSYLCVQRAHNIVVFIYLKFG